MAGDGRRWQEMAGEGRRGQGRAGRRGGAAALWGCVRARGRYPIGLRVDGVVQAEHRAYGGLALLAVRPAASLERGAQRVLGVGVRPLGCKELPQLRTHGERARRVLAERLAARVMHLRKEHRRRVGITVGVQTEGEVVHRSDGDWMAIA